MTTAFNKLLKACKAVDLVWTRTNLPSSAVHGPDCLGDDEHEAWGLVKDAIREAESPRIEG
jgi:hypothetical protein